MPQANPNEQELLSKLRAFSEDNGASWNEFVFVLRSRPTSRESLGYRVVPRYDLPYTDTARV